MWNPFSHKESILSSGVLRGATDWHCHLLPGVDDGIQSMDDTLALLQRYADAGVSHVWFTPHIMEDMPNRTADLRLLFSKVATSWHQTRVEKNLDPGVVTLHLAAENMLDNLFDERLAARDFLPIGEEADMLLVETSYYSPPMDLWGMLQRIQSAGYHPLLAHPERYLYMEKDDYHRLHQMGVRMQLNLPSLTGAYGAQSKERANWLLKLDYYGFMGTDTHRIKQFDHVMSEPKVNKSCQKLLANLQ